MYILFRSPIISPLSPPPPTSDKSPSVYIQEDYNSFPFQVILMLTNDSTMDTNSPIEIIEDQTNGPQNAMKRKTL